MCAIVGSARGERRSMARATLETRATVHLANQEFSCLTRDVSSEGLALTGHSSTLPPGTFMRVHLRLPDGRDMLDLDGILVRTDLRSSGMVWGLRFIAHQRTAQRRIKDYVEEHAAGSSTVLTRARHSHSSGSGLTSIGRGTPGTLAMPPGPSARTHLDTPSSPDPKPHSPPSKAVPDQQFYQLYEDAMARASDRYRPSAAPDRSAKPMPPTGRATPLSQRSKAAKAEGSTTELDVELHWLYEEAADKVG